METFLSILLVIIVLFIFALAVAYYVALHSYKNLLVREMPDVWNAERAKARPLESWIPTAYKLLQKSKGGSFEGHRASLLMVAAHKKAKWLLYVTASLFLVLLAVGLSLDAIS